MKALERRTRPTGGARATRRLFVVTLVVLVALVIYGVFSPDGTELPDRFHEVELEVTGMH